MTNRKTYALDTSILITDPSSFKSFYNSDVVLSITILDELDKLKKQPGSVGKSARMSIRLLDEVCEIAPDINAGILLDNDVFFKIDAANYEGIGDALYGDTRILACAQNLHKNGANVVLVSNDINMRVRARVLGMMAEGYEKEGAVTSNFYSGVQHLKDEIAGNDLISLGTIFPPSYGHQFFPNECIIFQDEEGNEMVKGRQIGNGNMRIIKKFYPWALAPRNIEQEMAIDLLMDPKISLVTLIGRAGSGKSVVALASALELVLEKRLFEKFIIYRPIQPMGNDIGYTPGSIAEKLEPWFQATMDNMEMLFTSHSGDKWRTNFETAKRKDKIQMEALTYIRGRSINNAIILIDEMQNLSKEEVKTILTRVGEGTKIICAGDLEQLDNPRLDSQNNGLAYIIEKFKNYELAGHITFQKGERSALATLAAEVL